MYPITLEAIKGLSDQLKNKRRLIGQLKIENGDFRDPRSLESDIFSSMELLISEMHPLSELEMHISKLEAEFRVGMMELFDAVGKCGFSEDSPVHRAYETLRKIYAEASLRGTYNAENALMQAVINFSRRQKTGKKNQSTGGWRYEMIFEAITREHQASPNRTLEDIMGSYGETIDKSFENVRRSYYYALKKQKDKAKVESKDKTQVKIPSPLTNTAPSLTNCG